MTIRQKIINKQKSRRKNNKQQSFPQKSKKNKVNNLVQNKRGIGCDTQEITRVNARLEEYEDAVDKRPN